MHGLYVTLKQLTMSLDILSYLYSYLPIFPDPWWSGGSVPPP